MEWRIHFVRKSGQILKSIGTVTLGPVLERVPISKIFYRVVLNEICGRGIFGGIILSGLYDIADRNSTSSDLPDANKIQVLSRLQL